MDVPLYAQKNRRFLGSLLVVSLLVRIGLFAWYMGHDEHYMLAFDSAQYQTIAEQIVQGKGIANIDGSPNLYRLPGYPLFLATCYKMFDGSTHAALIIQIIFASVIPLFVFLLALALFPTELLIAKIAAVAAMLHAGFIMYAGILSTESLFLFFFLLFLIYFYQQRLLFCAGIFLGIASLIRPVGHYLLVVAFLVLFLIQSRWAVRIKNMIKILLGWLAIVSPWLLRNYLLTGALFFHTLPGLHFLQYSAAGVEQARLGCDYFQAKKNVFALWDNDVAVYESVVGRAVTEHERFDIAQKVAVRYLLSHPILALKHACIQVARTCCTLYSTILLYVPLGTVYGDQASLWFKIKLYLFPRAIDPWLIPLIYWEMISYLLMLLGCILFLIQAFSHASLRWVLLKTLPFVVLMIIITLAYGCARLRFAVEPFMIVLAVYAWVRVLSSIEITKR